MLRSCRYIYQLKESIGMVHMQLIDRLAGAPVYTLKQSIGVVHYNTLGWIAWGLPKKRIR